MKMRAFISTWILLLTVFFVLPVHGKGNPQLNEALLQAAEKGDLREVRALIAKGADVNAGRKNPVTGVTDQTALTFAYQARHMDVVLELLNKGADIKAGWLPPYAERDIDVYRADLEINRIYNKLLGTLNPQQQKALREEQEAWIKRRDAEADRIARSTSVCCGSAYTHDYLTAKLDLIRKRIEVLERYTANNSPKPVPTPTPPPSMSKAQSPRIEKASLKRDFVTTDQRFMYLFDFDFVNALEQPIEIISVNVFDVNGDRLKQDWAMSGPSADSRLLTHELSGNHPLVKIFSKPGRGTPLEQATLSSVGNRLEIKVTNRILSAGQAIRPSGYILGSKNKYDSLILRVAYKVNGNLQEVSHTFTVGVREEAKPSSAPVVGKAGDTPRTRVHCSGAPFIFPVPAVDKSGKNSFIGWLYKEPTFGWENTTPDRSYYHSGLDFWASPNTPVMGQATGIVHQIENGNSGTFKPTIKYPNITYLDNNGNKKTGDVYVYIDNLVAGKIGNEEIKVPKKYDPVRVGKIVGLIGNAYPFTINGQQHIHWSVSLEPGKDQNLIQTPQSEAIQLDPTSFLTTNGKSLNARGERVWNTETLSWWCTGGQGK